MTATPPRACPECDYELPICTTTGAVIPLCSNCGTVAMIPADCYQPAPDVFFPGDEVDAGTWVLSAEGEVGRAPHAFVVAAGCAPLVEVVLPDYDDELLAAFALGGGAA